MSYVFSEEFLLAKLNFGAKWQLEQLEQNYFFNYFLKNMNKLKK
jgi:hypothetical protein